MNLINDLGNDLAMAFFVNKQHSEKIDKKEVLNLMNKVREELKSISVDRKETYFNKNNENELLSAKLI